MQYLHLKICVSVCVVRVCLYVCVDLYVCVCVYICIYIYMCVYIDVEYPNDVKFNIYV